MEMITERRIARKVALNERLNILRVQEELSEKNCDKCELKNNRQDPTILCGGCPVYKQLRELGDALMEVNKPKRKFAEEIPEEDLQYLIDSGAFLKQKKVLRVTKGFHDADGNSFKVGDLYKQKSNTQGNRITLEGRDGKEYSVTQHKYYNNFIDVDKFVEEYVPDTYVCVKAFRNREGTIKVKFGQEFKLIKEESNVSSKLMRCEEYDLRIGKDTFYKKLEKKRNDENE